jgi:hypothetical protein
MCVCVCMRVCVLPQKSENRKHSLVLNSDDKANQIYARQFAKMYHSNARRALNIDDPISTFFFW